MWLLFSGDDYYPGEFGDDLVGAYATKDAAMAAASLERARHDMGDWLAVVVVSAEAGHPVERWTQHRDRPWVHEQYSKGSTGALLWREVPA